MLDSTPTGINAKPVEVLVVHVSAALIDVACQVGHKQAAAGITKFDRFHEMQNAWPTLQLQNFASIKALLLLFLGIVHEVHAHLFML